MDKARQLAPHAARILVGLIFTVFGLNGFLQFIPMPPLPEGAGALMGALAASGYFFPVLKGTEVIAGLLLLSGRFVPFALVLLAPITLHIALFHLFLTPGEIGMGLTLVALLSFLGWSYRDAYKGLFNAHAKPAVPSPAQEAPVSQPAAA